MSKILGQKDAPEHADPETLGMALFNEQTSGQWAKLYEVNVFSIYFVTTAFLGLLAKGSMHYSPVVINVTSISGSVKIAQDHVSLQSSRLSRNDIQNEACSSRAIAVKRRQPI